MKCLGADEHMAHLALQVIALEDHFCKPWPDRNCAKAKGWDTGEMCNPYERITTIQPSGFWTIFLMHNPYLDVSQNWGTPLSILY